MPFFTSPREKHLWIWVFLVTCTIFSTLFVGQPLARILADQNIQAVIFLICMMLVGAAIMLHGIKVRPDKNELAIILGIVAVYVMLFLRLGIPERSHLMEYSVLAILIYKALIERKSKGIQIPLMALLAFAITFLIGVIDESIQLILPNRVFDPLDILFNGIVISMAIGFRSAIILGRKFKSKAKIEE